MLPAPFFTEYPNDLTHATAWLRVMENDCPSDRDQSDGHHGLPTMPSTAVNGVPNLPKHFEPPL